jgi:hypothetical protein
MSGLPQNNECSSCITAEPGSSSVLRPVAAAVVGDAGQQNPAALLQLAGAAR